MSDNRKKPGFGKQLADLHRWNAWLVVVLAATGLLLTWGAARGWLGEGRVWIKQLHIAVGVVSGILLVLYMPMMKKHWKQLRHRPRQKANLTVVLALLGGWLLSGIVLWQFRHFSPRWANVSLVVHDLLTWVGIPYAIFHSVTRMAWMRRPEKRAIITKERAEVGGGTSGSRAAGGSLTAGGSVGAVGGGAAVSGGTASGSGAAVGGGTAGGSGTAVSTGTAVGSTAGRLNRRQFLKWSLGTVLAVTVVPPFFRWVGRSLSSLGISPSTTDGMAETAREGNRMIPDPTPLPDSVNVVGGGAQGQFRVYTVTPLPTFDSQTWSFALNGLVDKPAVWNWEQFLRLARKVQVSDFHCVTGWSVYKNTWEGIPLAQLLDMAGVKSGATHVKLYSGDGVYTDALSLEQARMENVMVAVLHDGKPIGREYGGPVRLIVPKMYAYKSVKWLNRIELIDKPHTGYWEERGYDSDAWV